ncbi:MAG: 2OG-Fe(II) oxygenase family protein [Flavobacterium sp.]|jgi:Rps23 Pro-64 3,4-dihydroxylase Tpa1-like proline 4-hydroxylase|uniref:2OG-Fe(II) oxygenase family protein n=1 Tax=Flavobacterium algoritolerans TaxID=3041254 RepID=A0ABT6VDL7_9FLAO|nr:MULTISPECIES: 2OG-Fe(II) oxygenase family protein [Flavobacterium]MDI5889173.1 2OG-Fe(II) oxygenase family protein [Flavobacterium yafengii]MDI5896333.1 2OG-Fe(II) oxygenase family protein [Flavobacterium algoritolerans]MDI6050310.1 2OG-Fe(II) oxygenase family protein [Flavobacterium sp. XS2P24]MDP3682182.1 2OG-Fe(II) oxygenase family protein [Flavobacterium sp.]PIF62783.1 SM-20-related protein [Flavobacterium sp. 11]
MENSFEALIATYIENKVGISEHFLSTNLANNLKQNLIVLNQKSLLMEAGIGNSEKVSYDGAIRSDSIYWLDKKHNNAFENEFFAQIEAFIIYLNQSCYAGITGYEFHYSLYESGDFYLKHLDQFKNNPSRKYSMISYLNSNWQESDGGELLIHQADNNQKIAPTQGKTVFFKSDELVHEVLLTQNTRMSITGWLKSD